MRKVLPFFILTLMMFSPLVWGQNSLPKITDSFGIENPVINCGYPLNGNCLSLTATYPELRKTSAYEVSSGTYLPYGAYNGGTPVNANADDFFTNKIKLPFSFCFFGNNYNEIVIGSNGVVSFDSNQLGKINYPNVEYTNPDPALPKNMIFGAFSDLVFSKNNDSEILYSVIGSAPYRKFIVNFYKGRLLGCSESVSSQIVLSESTNTIEVFVENKPLPCNDAKFKNSLIGIINADGSLGYSPSERNTGIWAAKNEAWKFTPIGEISVPEVTWYNSKKEAIGMGDTIQVCPEKNEVFSIKVSYSLCGASDLILEDSASVTFAADFPLATNYTQIFCGGNNFNINLNDFKNNLTPQGVGNLIFTFHNTPEDAETGVNAQSEALTIDTSRIFYVRIQNPTSSTCFRTAVLNLTLISESLQTNFVEICDVNNDQIENGYVLSSLDSKLFNLPLNGTIHYYLSAADAAAGLREVKSTNLTGGQNLYVVYKTVSCAQVFGPVTVKFMPSPQVNTPLDYRFTTCDYKRDMSEPFEFLSVFGPLVTSEKDVKITFYLTYAEAYAGKVKSLDKVREGKYPVFVRVQSPGGCFSIGTINLDITFTKVEAKDKTVYECFNGTDDKMVNLRDHAREMLLQVPLGITTTFHANEADAERGANPISAEQTITKNGDFVTGRYFVRFENGDGCFAVKAITVNLVHVVIKKAQFAVCDTNNNGTEKVTLSAFSAAIKGTQNGTVTYFQSEEDARANRNSIASYEVQSTTTLYARIESFVCVDVFEITFQLSATPIVKEVVQLERSGICDNNNDGKESFNLTQLQPEIYSGSAPVTFSYYLTYNAASNTLTNPIAKPTAFVVPGETTVYAKVSFAGECFSVSTINIKLNFLPAIILKSAVLQKCDYEFNLNESFNLNDVTAQLFEQTGNALSLSSLQITYYKTEQEANSGLAAAQIKSPVVTRNSKTTVWARFTSTSTGCYSVAPIELQTYMPPKAMNSVIPVCDTNLDGKYNVNLTDFTDFMTYAKSADNIFKFYRTKADADTNKNALEKPENFSFDAVLPQLWVRVENIPGCFDTASINFTVGKKIEIKTTEPYVITDCDAGNDGLENIDLTRFEKKIFAGAATFEYYPSLIDLQNGTNMIATPRSYSYNQKLTSKIIVKVLAPGLCADKAEISVKLQKSPAFSIEDQYYCREAMVNVIPDFKGLNIVEYEWKNPQGKVVSTTDRLLDVKEEGKFTVWVKAASGCSYTTTFNVKLFEIPVITKLIANGNSFTVLATGSKSMVYAYRVEGRGGLVYQKSNIFHNLPYGVIEFYAKFEDSVCDPAMKRGLLVDVPNAFSPNDDGINDNWIIDDLNVFDGEKTNLKIFNRNQVKIFEQESATRLVWDGKTLSRAVPSDSYWYILTLADGRVMTGWILVKNRN